MSKLTAELQALGHAVGRRVVNELLRHLGYTLQANRKSTEGTQHPDRDAQFNYLNEQVRGAQEQGHPVISVDTKKKGLIGEFKNGGREYRIEHRLFSYVAVNWRGKPLVSLATVVNLVGATTTRNGLRVRSEIDTRARTLKA